MRIVLVEIRGDHLPGRRCGPGSTGRWHENIHVGLRHRAEVVQLVPGDAAAAQWTFEVQIRSATNGTIDFGGPFVQGRRGDRHVKLAWGEVDEDGAFRVFRAAKLLLDDIDTGAIDDALRPRQRLVARLGLTDAKGHPRCARVRAPDVAWFAG